MRKEKRFPAFTYCSSPCPSIVSIGWKVKCWIVSQNSSFIPITCWSFIGPQVAHSCPNVTSLTSALAVKKGNE